MEILDYISFVLYLLLSVVDMSYNFTCFKINLKIVKLLKLNKIKDELTIIMPPLKKRRYITLLLSVVMPLDFEK